MNFIRKTSKGILMIIKSNVFLILYLGIQLLNGQVSEYSLPKITPASPTSSELGKYGFESIGLYTGSPNVNIPLYEINVGSFSLPISLNYSSNGIRVDQISTENGLGWSLSAGGIITRILKDESDEDYRVSLPNASFTSEEMKNFLYNTINGTGIDTQPDLFSFNFGGYAGKFYLNNNLEPALIDPLPLKIEMISNLSFKITDPNGVVYYFGNGNCFEESSTRTYGVGGSNENIMTEPSITAWYLEKIKLLNGEEISFSYNQISGIYDLSIYQSVTAKKTQNPFANGGYPTYYSAIHKLPIITKQYITTPLLSQIEFKDGFIQFDYSKRYDDIATNFKKLDYLSVFSTNNVLLKKVQFKYDQKNALVSFQNPDNSGNDLTNSKRLFLSEIIMFPNNLAINQKYSFEYYSPDQLPPRLSYAQDYWGYFNGKSNSDLVTDDISLFNPMSYEDPEFSYNLLGGLFSNVGGDKSADGNFGVKGLLKKVIYPTGGNSEFIYEPHSYFGTKEIPANLISKSININTGSGELNNSQSITTGVIPYFQEKNPIYFSVGKTSCWGTGWPDHKVKAVLSVKIKPVGSSVFSCPGTQKGFYQIDQNGQKIYEGGCSIDAEQNVFRQFYMDFEEDKNYEFTLTLNWECIRGDMGFTYYNQAPQIVDSNIEVGGLRVKQNVINDGNGKEEIINYHYGDLNCIDCSSGELETLRPSLSFTTYDYFSSGAQTIETVANLSSSTLRPLYDSQGYHINYRSVIEEFGDNFFNGGVFHEYNIVYDNPPYIFGDNIPGTSYSNGFGNGKELRTTKFKFVENNYIPTMETVYHYKLNDNRLDDSILGFVASYRKIFSAPSALGMTASFYEFNFNKYYTNTHWVYLDQVTNKAYDLNGLNPVTTATNYYYDNENHLQLTRSTTVNSNGEVIENKMCYPDDVTATSSLPGGSILGLELNAIISLNSDNQHRINIPIQVEKTENGQLTRTRTIFKDWKANSNGGRIIEPQFIKSQKGSGSLENRITFYDYDVYGNVLDVGKTLGSRVSYIWGYNNHYPIAKIENLNYSAISSITINDLKTKSNLDTSIATENTLRLALNGLRSSYTGSLINTYTYNPLVGMTSATDPSGYTTFYEYDAFNRLEFIENKDSKVVKSYDYHYKTDIPQYTISSTTNGNGTVTLSKTIINEGESVTVTISPNSGYQISSIKVNGVTRSISSSFTLSNITSNTVVDVQFSVVAAALAVSPTSMDFDWIDGNKTATVTASGNWTVSKSASWITISATSGSGNGSFTVKPSKNNGSERYGTVTVTQSGTSKTIAIRQFASDF